MDAIKAIMTRRSVRKFTAEPVMKEQVETILRAAMQAPSAGNQQPWHFVVVTDRALLAKIPEVHPHARMATEAAIGILVCADTRLERHRDYWPQDCSAAVENLLLAAHALGLGAVWTGIYPRMERAEGFRKLFGLPEEVVPLAFVPCGHPAESKPADDRYKPDRVHIDRWS